MHFKCELNELKCNYGRKNENRPVICRSMFCHFLSSALMRWVRASCSSWLWSLRKGQWMCENGSSHEEWRCQGRRPVFSRHHQWKSCGRYIPRLLLQTSHDHIARYVYIRASLPSIHEVSSGCSVHVRSMLAVCFPSAEMQEISLVVFDLSAVLCCSCWLMLRS